MPDRSEDWIGQARRDLASAVHSQEGGFHEWACFMAQQAAEKAVNAAYQRLGADAWGHSLIDLLRGLEERAKVSEDLKDCGRQLDRHYLPTRYPNGFPNGKPSDYYTARDAQDAIVCSRKIIQFCESVLA